MMFRDPHHMKVLSLVVKIHQTHQVEWANPYTGGWLLDQALCCYQALHFLV